MVLANRSLDPNLLKFYDEGLGDMHSFVASLMYPELRGLTLKEIKEQHAEKRTNVKAAGFAINYGGTGATIADNLGISRQEGDNIYNSYFRIFPGLRNYFNGAKKQGVDNGYILISEVTGRKSYLPGYEKFLDCKSQLTSDVWSEYAFVKGTGSVRESEIRQLIKDYYHYLGEIERKSLNYPIQGTSAEITKISGVYIFDWIVDNNLFGKVWFCNMVHDENVLECPEPMAREVAAVVKDCMQRAAAIFCKRVPLLLEPVIHPFWKK